MFHLDDDAVLGNSEHEASFSWRPLGPCTLQWMVISCFSWTGTASARCGSLKVPVILATLVTPSALFSTIGSQRVE